VLECVPQARILEYELVEDLAELLPKILALRPDDQPLFGRYHYDEEDRLMIKWTSMVGSL